MDLPHIVIGKGDVERLNSVLSCGTLQADVVREFLCQELDRALVLEDWLVPATVVKMGSTVLFRQEDTGERRVARIVYPGEKPYYGASVSIETPLGVALLGLSEGQAMNYFANSGRSRKVVVFSILGSVAPGFAPQETGHMDRTSSSSVGLASGRG